MRERPHIAAAPRWCMAAPGVVLALVVVMLALGGARAAPPETVRGILGSVEFRAGGPRIVAKATQTLDSPIVVRVAEAAPQEDGWTRYRLEFIGAVAGEHDLSEYLERQDGSPLNVAPIKVTIVSQLEVNHGSELFESANAPELQPTRYRAVMTAIAAIWVAVPVVYIIVRRLRRPPPQVVVAAPPPLTLADQIRPLAEAAMSGSLSIEDRGRLELLLYLYWSGRRRLSGRQAEIISQLRIDAEAGELLRSVEKWLHAPPADDARGAAADGARGAVTGATSQAELARLLEPYRHADAIDTGRAATPRGPGAPASPAPPTTPAASPR